MIRYLLMALLFAVPVSAWAQFSVEVGVGVAHAGVRSDGTWYQNNLPHTIKSTSGAAELNVRWQFRPDTSLIVGVVDLGRYSSNSQDNPNDAAYAAHVSLPLAHYVGSGRLWGVQAMLERTWGDAWQIGVRGGLLAYHESWRMDVPNWYPSDPVGTAVWYTPRETVNGYMVGPVVPIHSNDQRWALGAIVGATVSHRDWPVSLSIEYVMDGAKFSGHPGGWPPIWKSHLVALVSYRF
ncbi:MAG: hypothetical protein KGL35_17010 [Bradyrhizobium sp.]|nr:hypothetical protein [Bradyrhizobium sp.]